MVKPDAASVPRAADGRLPGRRGLATRQKLVDCTRDLLATTRYRDLKVTDITRSAGTSSATFYQYFLDLEAVMLAVAEETAEEGLELARLIADHKWQGAAGLTSAGDLVDGFLEFWRAHRPQLRVLDLLTSEGDERFRRTRTVMLNAITRELASAITAVRTTDRNDDVDPMAMAGALIGTLANLSAHQSGFEAWNIPMAEVREAMVRLLYWGVTGPRLPRR
ncbi:MAG TPA: hypothetical protein VNG13_11260 [Mycobacteriales bacterium]|nr:hypothetical protein [Mycobacteriales bacterium]